MRSEKCAARTRLQALLLVFLFGCATVDPTPDYEAARERIRASTGEETVFDPDAPLLKVEEIREMLSDGLGLEEATRLALLNNRRLQAGFMSLGVARAEYVQARLLENPSLSLAFLFPDGGGRAKWAADLATNVAELWQIPSRKRVAKAGLEERIFEVSRFAGELVLTTKAAYFESVAAREARAVTQANADLARRSLEAVQGQVKGGVAKRTEENLAQSLALSAELSFQRAERKHVEAKRELAALLSLEDDLLDIELTDPLPDPRPDALEREPLVERSRRLRPDLQAALSALAAAEAEVVLERRRKLPGVSAGISAERPEGGSSIDFLVGPSATIELPIFDQNQARVSRAEFRRDELKKEYEALVAEVVQSVRATADKALVAAKTAEFVRTELLPQAEQSAALAQRAYEFGDTTVLTLLEAQKAVLEARRTGLESLMEAARTRLDVERAAGGPIDDAPEGNEPEGPRQ